MNTARPLAALVLALPLVGCASVAASTSESPAAAAKDGDKAESSKKERALEYAKLRLEITGMKVEGAERAEQQALEQAKAGLEDKAAALEDFRTNAAPLELDQRELSLRRAKQRALESEQEIAELEAMYAQEDFAETTKELVLTRGRAQLEMARRGLELAQREFDHTKTVVHPKRERELTREVQRAEQAVAKAQLDLARGALQRRLELLEAEHAVQDAAQALEG